MKVTVFGVGYVGLVQAAVLAEVGHDVCCVDVDVEKIEMLKSGLIPIYEPGLEEIVNRSKEAGRLEFTNDPQKGVEFGEVLFIAVGTPADNDGAVDLSYLMSVVDSIALHMEKDRIVVVKSTVPVGTSDKVLAYFNKMLIECSKGYLTAHVVFNPEFLKEGAAVNDCLRPDRIIVGVFDELVLPEIRELYEPFNRNHERMIVMDVKSAELTKYAANCMLATKISFMNEMANISELVGADIEMVRKGIGSDPRIGHHFIYPGCGYGGSCFPKDIKALLYGAESKGYKALILDAVEKVNSKQKGRLFEHVENYFGRDLAGKVIAVWGLSFKPNTDDVRDAPSRVLMESLWKAGAKVQAFDPVANLSIKDIYGDRADLQFSNNKEDVLEGADALVVCTEWQIFKAPDFDEVKTLMKFPVIFDGRNLYDPKKMRELGVTYFSIGR